MIRCATHVADMHRAATIGAIKVTCNNVVHPHFVWSRFLPRHTDAAMQNREARFPAWIAGSEGEPIMCVTEIKALLPRRNRSELVTTKTEQFVFLHKLR